MRVAANLTMLFEEAGSLLQRYEVAADAGFKCIEISSPYGVEAEQLRDVQEKLGLELVQINSPPGMACMPDKRDKFHKSIDVAIHYAKVLQCKRIHVIAGMTPTDVPRVQSEQVFVENLTFAAKRLAEDTFHTQCICGQLTKTIKDLSQHIGHVQVAQVPDRHEPHSSGEINYDYVFKLLQDTGYDGFIGAEYIPEKSTTAGLGWIDKYGLSL